MGASDCTPSQQCLLKGEDTLRYRKPEQRWDNLMTSYQTPALRSINFPIKSQAPKLGSTSKSWLSHMAAPKLCPLYCSQLRLTRSTELSIFPWLCYWWHRDLLLFSSSASLCVYPNISQSYSQTLVVKIISCSWFWVVTWVPLVKCSRLERKDTGNTACPVVTSSSPYMPLLTLTEGEVTGYEWWTLLSATSLLGKSKALMPIAS